MSVELLEVGPRDGLQNESSELNVDIRFDFVEKLSKTGLSRIEAGSFVSEKWVPQMKGTDQLFSRINKSLGDDGVRYSALVPNRKGLDAALKAGVKEIAFFTAASEEFTKKNINCTVDESIERAKEIMSLVDGKGITVRSYVSTAFYCPYSGKVDRKSVVDLVEKLIGMGSFEISIGDTIGAANPIEVRALLKELKAHSKKLAMHFHDTRGTALANIVESLDHGIRVFDTSLGGLGGCPYAPGAAGNVATEDVVYCLEGMGEKTGVDLDKLIEINAWMSEKLGKKLPSRVAQAGRPHV